MHIPERGVVGGWGVLQGGMSTLNGNGVEYYFGLLELLVGFVRNS